MYLTRCEKAKLYSLCMLCMLYLDTLYYDVSRIPPPRGKFQGSRMVLRFNSRTLTPHCRTLEVWVFGVVFLCRNLPLRQLQIFMDHVEVDTWKAWCPSFLGTVQSARNFGHWKAYHFRSMISTCIYGTVRELTAILNLSKHGAPSDEVLFLCKNCNVTHNRLQGRRSLKQ